MHYIIATTKGLLLGLMKFQRPVHSIGPECEQSQSIFTSHDLEYPVHWTLDRCDFAHSSIYAEAIKS